MRIRILTDPAGSGRAGSAMNLDTFRTRPTPAEVTRLQKRLQEAKCAALTCMADQVGGYVHLIREIEYRLKYAAMLGIKGE